MNKNDFKARHEFVLQIFPWFVFHPLFFYVPGTPWHFGCVHKSFFFFLSALFSSFINQHMQSWPILLWLKDTTLQRRLRQEIMFWFSFSGHGLHIVAFRVKFFNEANRSLVPPLPWEKVYPSYTGSFPSIIHIHEYFAWTLAYMHAWCHMRMHMTPIWADDGKIVSYECLGLELGYGKWWQLSLWK